MITHDTQACDSPQPGDAVKTGFPLGQLLLCHNKSCENQGFFFLHLTQQGVKKRIKDAE